MNFRDFFFGGGGEGAKMHIVGLAYPGNLECDDSTGLLVPWSITLKLTASCP